MVALRLYNGMNRLIDFEILNSLDPNPAVLFLLQTHLFAIRSITKKILLVDGAKKTEQNFFSSLRFLCITSVIISAEALFGHVL